MDSVIQGLRRELATLDSKDDGPIGMSIQDAQESLNYAYESVGRAKEVLDDLRARRADIVAALKRLGTDGDSD